MKRSAPLKRSRIKPKPRDEAEEADEAEWRHAVHVYAGFCCERCGQLSTEAHHRRTREVKWSKWLRENGLALCSRCHHVVVHGNVDWSRRHGLILSRHSTTHPLPVLDCGLDCPVDHYG